MKNLKTFNQFIKESSINEYSSENFKAIEIKAKDVIKPNVFIKLMPRTAKTVKDATDKIETFNGTAMATHVQYFIVRPNGNREDRPTYRIHEDQYYKWRKGDPKVDISKLHILELKEGANAFTSQGDDWVVLGSVYVQTSAFLDELNRVFEVLKRVS
jgi:hypothetical protein